MEKDNFIVPLRKNVSPEVKHVIQQCVIMMVLVVERRAVSVVIVSMVALMIKTNVVSSEVSRLCVVMIISLMENQVLVVSLRKNGTL